MYMYTQLPSCLLPFMSLKQCPLSIIRMVLPPLCSLTHGSSPSPFTWTARCSVVLLDLVHTKKVCAAGQPLSCSLHCSLKFVIVFKALWVLGAHSSIMIWKQGFGVFSVIQHHASAILSTSNAAAYVAGG